MPNPDQDPVIADDVNLTDGDPFAILGDDDSNPDASLEGGTQGASPAPDGGDSLKKEFPDGKHWQSEHDKLKREYDELKQQIGPYIPIVQSLDKNPQITAVLVKAMQEQRVAAEAAKVLVKPEIPQKPVQYDPHDAVTNPESVSYKYREAVEQYQANVVDYLEKREAEREGRMTALIEGKQKEEEQRRQLAIMRAELTKAGFKPEEQADFLQFFSKPDNLQMSDLIALFKQRKSTEKLPGSPGASRSPGLPQGGSSGQDDVIDPKNTGQVFSAGLKQYAR